MFKRLLLVSVLICLASGTLYAETRVLSPANDLRAIRPVGERRVWSFIDKDTTLGLLESVVSGTGTIDSRSALTIKSYLRFDLSLIGQAQKIETENEYAVDSTGHFLASRISFDIGENRERIEIERDGFQVRGFATRAGQEIDQQLELPEMAAVNSYFVDQWEIWLAGRGIEVGEKIDEDIFVPQDMLTTHVEGYVQEFHWQRLHETAYDSVFAVRLTRPQNLWLYMNKDYRLLKVQFLDLDVRAYLDLVQQPKPEQAATPKVAAKYPLSAYIPSYLLYLLFSGITALFFVGIQYREPKIYFGFMAGAVLFALTMYTQLPLQEALFTSLLLPAVKAGKSIMFIGLVPAFLSAFVQTALLFIGLLLLLRFAAPKKQAAAALAVLIGVTFGLVEACYVAYGQPPDSLTGLNLIERGFMILFYGAAMVLLSTAIRVSIARASLIAVVLAAINGLIRYFPIIARTKIANAEVLNFGVAIISLAVLVWALVKQKRTV